MCIPPVVAAAVAERRGRVGSLDLMKSWLCFGAALAVIPFFTACRSEPSNSAEASSVSESGSEAFSLYEQRLIRVMEDVDALNAMAEKAGEVDLPEVKRHFHNVANTFKAIIADNPDQIEVRLLYAKMLDAFGDRTGASSQCGEVLNRDPTVAVAHQMLGTFFAEEGDYFRALSFYLNAIQAAPGEATYYFGLGDLLYTFRPGFIKDGVFTSDDLDAKVVEAFRQAAEFAPDELRYQFRYGESFYDLPDPDWTLPLAIWERLSARADLSDLQREAIWLHQARCLGELARYEEARASAAKITETGLFPSRDALLDAIDAAEAAEGTRNVE